MVDEKETITRGFGCFFSDANQGHGLGFFQAKTLVKEVVLEGRHDHSNIVWRTSSGT
jgi:hypothetical protein